MVAWWPLVEQLMKHFLTSTESIDVFTSWRDKSRVDTKIEDFENLWQNKTKHVSVHDFSHSEKNNLLKYLV